MNNFIHFQLGQTRDHSHDIDERMWLHVTHSSWRWVLNIPPWILIKLGNNKRLTGSDSVLHMRRRRVRVRVHSSHFYTPALLCLTLTSLATALYHMKSQIKNFTPSLYKSACLCVTCVWGLMTQSAAWWTLYENNNLIYWINKLFVAHWQVYTVMIKSVSSVCLSA